MIQKPADQGLLTQLALEPQRIRTFEISYTTNDAISQVAASSALDQDNANSLTQQFKQIDKDDESNEDVTMK